MQNLPLEIAAFDDGGAALSAIFRGEILFGEGEPNETELTSIGGSDVLVARFNSDGSLAWARSFGGELADYVGGVAALPDGGVVVSGWCNESATFGRGEPGETTITCDSAEGRGMYVARLGASGNLLWARTDGGDFALDVALLDDESVAVIGRHNDGATFGAGEPMETSFSLGGGFLAVYEL